LLFKNFRNGKIKIEGTDVATEVFEITGNNSGLHFLNNFADIEITDLCVKRNNLGNGISFEGNTGKVTLTNYGVKSDYNGIYSSENSRVRIEGVCSSDCSNSHFTTYFSKIVVYAAMTYAGAGKYAVANVDGEIILRDSALHHSENLFSDKLFVGNSGKIIARLYKWRLQRGEVVAQLLI